MIMSLAGILIWLGSLLQLGKLKQMMKMHFYFLLPTTKYIKLKIKTMLLDVIANLDLFLVEVVI